MIVAIHKFKKSKSIPVIYFVLSREAITRKTFEILTLFLADFGEEILMYYHLHILY